MAGRRRSSRLHRRCHIAEDEKNAVALVLPHQWWRRRSLSTPSVNIPSMLGPPAGLAQERYVQRGAIAIAASAVPTRKGRYSTTSERFPPVEAKQHSQCTILASIAPDCAGKASSHGCLSKCVNLRGVAFSATACNAAASATLTQDRLKLIMHLRVGNPFAR